MPDWDRRSDGRSDGRTESIIAKTALCIASYADALSKMNCIGVRSQLWHIAYLLGDLDEQGEHNEHKQVVNHTDSSDDDVDDLEMM